MRILPPFVVTRADIDTAMDILDRNIAAVHQSQRAA
jgi:hypothetical protein